MKINTTTTQWTTTQTAEYINLTDKIILVKMTISCNDEIIKTDYFPAHINDINNFANVDYNPKQVRNKFMWFAIMRKEFIDAYAKYNPQTYAFYVFCDKYEMSRKDVYEGLVSGEITLDDIVLTENNNYNNTIYPFVYGKTKEGWFPHMIAYNWDCYMLTNENYDLESVKNFLIPLEKNGEVIICRDYIEDEEIIQKIPSYNVTGVADRYINFYFLAKEPIDVDFSSPSENKLELLRGVREFWIHGDI